MFTPISLVQAEYVAHVLVQRLMKFDEPMPDFGTRYKGKLESCLVSSFQTYDSKLLYQGFTKKAAVLFYSVIKDHPFINGNKRMAVTLTMTFAYTNGKWLNIPPKELYDIACEVAESAPQERDMIIDILTKVFNRYVEKA